MVKIQKMKKVRKIKVNSFYFFCVDFSAGWNGAHPVLVKENGYMIFTFKEHTNYKKQKDRFAWSVKQQGEHLYGGKTRTLTYDLKYARQIILEALKNNDVVVEK